MKGKRVGFEAACEAKAGWSDLFQGELSGRIGRAAVREAEFVRRGLAALDLDALDRARRVRLRPDDPLRPLVGGAG